MNRKPFAAFGRILYANYYSQGETVEVVTSANSQTILFLSEGDVTARDKATNEVIWECGPGWFSGSHQDRVYNVTANTPAVCWCYDPLINQNYVPMIEVMRIPQGRTIGLPIGTNLFLCTGAITIDEREFAGPYQLSVRSKDVVATATTDVWGLLFK